MTKIDTTCESIKLRLIAAAVGLQQCTKTAANIVPIPDGRVIVIGTPAEVVGLLPAHLASQSQAAQPSELTDDAIEELAVDYYRAMTDSIDDVIGFARAVEREVLAGQSQATKAQAEPIAYVNGDELDNMLDDRTATIQSSASGWRRTPLYVAPVAKEAPAVPEFTDDQIMDMAEPFHDVGGVQFDEVAFARSLIAHLGAPAVLGDEATQDQLVGAMYALRAIASGIEDPSQVAGSALAVIASLAAVPVASVAQEVTQQAAKAETAEQAEGEQANVLPPFAAPASQHDAARAAIIGALSQHRMVCMYEVEEDGGLGNTYSLIDCLSNDGAIDIASGKAEIEAIADAVLDALDDESLARRFRAQGGNTNAESSDIAPTTSTVSAPEEVRDATPDWQECERIANVPIVDDALRGFSEDPTANNGICVVIAVLDALRTTSGKGEAA